MSPMERHLKYAMLQNERICRKIITSQELNAYLQWDVDTYTGKIEPGFTEDDISIFPNLTHNPEALEYVRAFLSNDSKFLPFHIPSLTSEQDEIQNGHHIAVGRMLRYFPAHWHANDYFAICYSVSGSCPVHFQNEVITVSPGTVLIIAPSVVHAAPCYEDDQVLLYFSIRSSTFQQIFWNQLPQNSLMASFFRQALSSQNGTAYLYFETGNDAEIRTCIYEIYREYCQNQRYSAHMLNALMSTFFVLLLRRYEGTARLPRRSDFFWKHEFSAILTYIQIHYPTANIETVARQFHYSPRQIGRIVQSCTGMSFSELILKLRMEQAEKLLLQKGGSIDQISASVGYSTPSSFFRAFAKYHGCTPREYILRNQDKNSLRNNPSGKHSPHPAKNSLQDSGIYCIIKSYE